MGDDGGKGAKLSLTLKSEGGLSVCPCLGSVLLIPPHLSPLPSRIFKEGKVLCPERTGPACRLSQSCVCSCHCVPALLGALSMPDRLTSHPGLLQLPPFYKWGN